MERRHVYGAVSVVAAALMFPGCGDGKAPVQPTPVPVAPPLQEFRLSGNVSDTASRPLAGSKVEVMDGPRAGTAATTDEAGRFTMPGTFTGNITVTGWKDGYVRETRSIPSARCASSFREHRRTLGDSLLTRTARSIGEHCGDVHADVDRRQGLHELAG